MEISIIMSVIIKHFFLFQNSDFSGKEKICFSLTTTERKIPNERLGELNRQYFALFGQRAELQDC